MGAQMIARGDGPLEHELVGPQVGDIAAHGQGEVCRGIGVDIAGFQEVTVICLDPKLARARIQWPASNASICWPRLSRLVRCVPVNVQASRFWASSGSASRS